MKIPICMIALASLISECGAAPFDLEIPPLSYKATEAFSSPSFLSKGALSFFERRPQRSIMRHPTPQPIAGGHSFSKMPIISPKGGVDYKLTIVAADPTIDPKMLLPTSREAAVDPTGR